MTAEEMAALTFHPGWADGRKGFQWCRFDAIVCEERKLRAELTWDDDGETRNDSPPQHFTEPRIWLEVNEVSVDRWVTIRGIGVDLTDEDVQAILNEPPAKLLERYPAKWDRICHPDEEKGHG